MKLDSKIMEKAATLIEALPYIQKFNRKIIVVKYGGSAMADEELKRNVIKDVVLLSWLVLNLSLCMEEAKKSAVGYLKWVWSRAL